MIIRNVVDYTGALIGVMEFDDDTTEEQIAEALAPFALPPPPAPIADVTAAQLEEALELNGKTKDEIESVFDRNMVSRTDAFVIEGCAMLNLTDAEMDAIFIQAASL